MGIEALTYREDGTEIVVPQSTEDWRSWVSAGRTRNWMLHDPLIDWLQLYGKSRNFVPSQELSRYDQNLDFLEFIFEKGREFEAGILRLLQDNYEVAILAADYRDILSLRKAEETFASMQSGVPVIHQGVLWDVENRNYGAPDFLVRSDVLREIFPGELTETEASLSAPDIGDQGWHYRVVDTKFTTLHLNASGEVGNDGSAPAYKAQLYVYNRMLGRLQGFEPQTSFLLGRGWQQRRDRGSSAFDRLGPVPQSGTVPNGIPIAAEVERALRWIRRVREEGGVWQLSPEPSVPELYPNMSNSDDGDVNIDVSAAELDPDLDPGEARYNWMGVKKWLAAELKELTQLWQVGPDKRSAAHSAGFRRWDDQGLTPEAVGINGASQRPVLEQILAVNSGGGPPVRPARIENTRTEWHDCPLVEFYVDFEFCSDLNDDFSRLPERGGQPLVFMIGCGHLEDGEWQFRSFVAELLSEEEELRVIREWVDHMSAVRDRLDPGDALPRLMHWSHAEVTAIENAYNSARNRHGEHADWPQLGWYDFLQNVMRKEPIVVRGSLGFGLKAVANAMRANGLIETGWEDSQVDGLGAMVGAWRCDALTREYGVPMSEIDLMGEIIRYNEVDCRVMMEIVRYLRMNH